MNFIHDLRRAANTLLRQPGLAGLAVLALGLGIGMPTAMFGFLHSAVLRGLPVPDAGRIMHIERRPIGQTGEGWGAAARDYVGWVEQQQSFDELGAFHFATVTLRAEQAVDRWQAAYLTPSSFRSLGAAAARGRTFGAAEEGADAQGAVLLSHHVWRDRFGADPGAIGRTAWVDGVPRTVVGVMPPDFRFPTGQDLWLPLVVPPGAAEDAAFPRLEVFGKLRAGRSLSDARAEFAVIARRMAERHPQTNEDLEVAVRPFTQRFVGTNATRQMYIVLGAVLLVLVIACTNVANLLLVRAVHRGRELAILAALGATRARMMRQVLSESLVLAAAGGVLGVGIAHAALGALTGLFGDRLPYWAEPRLDGSVLLFALALVVAASVVAAVLPALKTTYTDLAATLRDDSRGTTGMRVGRVMQGLVVLEVALSLGLLVTTGLLVRSVRNAQSVDLGFAVGDVVTASLSLPESYDAAARLRFYDALERGIRTEPTVAAAGFATALPATHAGFARIAVEGVTYADPDDRPAVRYAAASGDYFAALGVRPLEGRLFAADDAAGREPVALVNARLVQRLFPEGDAVGRRIRVGGGDDAAWHTIVGVVPDLWMGALDSWPERNPAGVYVPLAQAVPSTIRIVARVRAGQPLALTGAVRQAAFGLDPDVPIYDVRSMPQVIEDNNWFYGMVAGIVGACGLVALLLASIGLYGVIAFSVGRRVREFGIRMAFGAEAGHIVRLVLRRGTLQLVIGLTLGLLLATLLARGLAMLLFQVSPSDPASFGGIALLLLAVCVAAMLVPALRAARVDPLTALRAE